MTDKKTDAKKPDAKDDKTGRDARLATMGADIGTETTKRGDGQVATTSKG